MYQIRTGGVYGLYRQSQVGYTLQASSTPLLPSLLPTPPLSSLGFVQAVAAAAAWDYRRRREASHVCSVVWRTGVRHGRTQG